MHAVEHKGVLGASRAGGPLGGKGLAGALLHADSPGEECLHVLQCLEAYRTHLDDDDRRRRQSVAAGNDLYDIIRERNVRRLRIGIVDLVDAISLPPVERLLQK